MRTTPIVIFFLTQASLRFRLRKTLAQIIISAKRGSFFPILRFFSFFQFNFFQNGSRFQFAWRLLLPKILLPQQHISFSQIILLFEEDTSWFEFRFSTWAKTSTREISSYFGRWNVRTKIWIFFAFWSHQNSTIRNRVGDGSKQESIESINSSFQTMIEEFEALVLGKADLEHRDVPMLMVRLPILGSQNF